MRTKSLVKMALKEKVRKMVKINVKRTRDVVKIAIKGTSKENY